jgi:hypothetical protein
VNTAVLSWTLKYGKRYGLAAAFGGAIPELLYAALAVFAGQWIGKLIDPFVDWVKLLFAVVFVCVGLALIVYGFRHKASAPKLKVLPKSSVQLAMFSGLSLGLGNFQLIIFWTAIAVWLNQGIEIVGIKANLLDFLPGQIGFVAGAGVGAFLLLVGLVYVSGWLNQILKPNQLKWLLGILGTGLVLTGAWQLAYLIRNFS